MRSHARLLVWLSTVMDAVVVAVIFATMGPMPDHASLWERLTSLLIVPVWVNLLWYFGVYASHRVGGIKALLRKIASAHFVGINVLLFAALVTRTANYEFLLRFAAVSLLILSAQKMVVFFVLRRIRSRGLDQRNVLVIGSLDAARELHNSFREQLAWGLKVTMLGEGSPESRTFIQFPDGSPAGESLEEALKSHVIDEVVLAVKPDQLALEQLTIHICERHGIVARIVLGDVLRTAETARAEDYFGSPSLAVGPSRDAGLTVKHALDAVLSALLLVTLLPLMVLLAFVVKLSSEGPVIFKQTRVGLRGRRFTMFKFRTMVCGAEALMPTLAAQTVMGGPVYKQFSDPRVTAAGRILRKFSLDELPQLWNVLRGDMSLVGPRPLPVSESAAIEGEYRRRFSMRPGLTCFWQVSGRSQVGFSEWMQYDLQYVDGWSLKLDLKLILQTIPAVLTGRGAC